MAPQGTCPPLRAAHGRQCDVVNTGPGMCAMLLAGVPGQFPALLVTVPIGDGLSQTSSGPCLCPCLMHCWHRCRPASAGRTARCSHISLCLIFCWMCRCAEGLWNRWGSTPSGGSCSTQSLPTPRLTLPLARCTFSATSVSPHQLPRTTDPSGFHGILGLAVTLLVCPRSHPHDVLGGVLCCISSPLGARRSSLPHALLSNLPSLQVALAGMATSFLLPPARIKQELPLWAASVSFVW